MDPHKPVKVEIENRGEINYEQFIEANKNANQMLVMRMLKGEWQIIVDSEFAECLRRLGPLERMRVATTVIDGVRKAMQAITDR